MRNVEQQHLCHSFSRMLWQNFLVPYGTWKIGHGFGSFFNHLTSQNACIKTSSSGLFMMPNATVSESGVRFKIIILFHLSLNHDVFVLSGRPRLCRNKHICWREKVKVCKHIIAVSVTGDELWTRTCGCIIIRRQSVCIKLWFIPGSFR